MTPKTILAIQGASSEVVQGLLASCARDWAAAGARVVGIVETRCPRSGRKCLRDLRTGADYVIEQDLGPGSSACRLIAAGIVDACASVQRQILSGCDVVVLSKFGKLEAARNGLVAAFTAAVETGAPVLTGVSPTFAEPWSRFAGALAAYAPANRLALDAWWTGIRPADEERTRARPDTAMQGRPMASEPRPFSDTIR